MREWKKGNSLADSPGKERKRKSSEEKEQIVEAATEQPFTTPKKLRREQQITDLSPRTIRRTLNEHDLHGRVSRPSFPFTSSDIRKRLSFANGYSHWTEEDWDKVLWSDEAHIEMGQHGQVWVQRPVGEAFNPQYTHKDKTSHPSRVSIWACFSSYGVGGMEVWENYTMDKKMLRTILIKHLLPSASVFPSGQWYFQQDNARTHNSALVQDWLHSNGITP